MSNLCATPLFNTSQLLSSKSLQDSWRCPMALRIQGSDSTLTSLLSWVLVSSCRESFQICVNKISSSSSAAVPSLKGRCICVQLHWFPMSCSSECTERSPIWFIHSPTMYWVLTMYSGTELGIGGQRRRSPALVFVLKEITISKRQRDAQSSN